MKDKNSPIEELDEKQAVTVLQDWANFLIGLIPVVSAAAHSFGKVIDNIIDFVDNRTTKEY